ncbi:MAG: DUF3568 family protein [Nitrospiraceae bacterium]
MQTIAARGVKTRRTIKHESPTVRAACLAVCLLWLGCSGCVPLLVGAAAGTAGAVYVMGKLQEELAEPVQTVHEAAVQGLKDLALPILEDTRDKLTGRLESEFADGSHVWITLDSIAEFRTRITIRAGVVGNEVRSRQILKAITAHLPDSHIS